MRWICKCTDPSVDARHVLFTAAAEEEEDTLQRIGTDDGGGGLEEG